ncbi:MAG: LCP family protein [Lactovum sp.]
MKVWMKSLLMFLALVLVISITAVVYATTIWNSASKTLEATYTDIGQEEVTINETEPLTILLMGVDTGDTSRGGEESWAGNSDSMIILTLNPETETSTMFSMERDTMANILDAEGVIESTQKMNAAYPSGYNADGITGAAQWAMATISSQAGISLDNFIAINMNGLVKLVDDVGGIDVYNDPANWIATPDNAYPEGTIYISDTEPAYTETIAPGQQHINGEQALVYSRDRHHRLNGDYGRIAAQREVITQLMVKLFDMDNMSQYQKFLDDVSSDVRTNIQVSTDNFQSLLAYRNCFKKIVSIQYQGVGDMVDGISYQFTPEETLLAIQNSMKLSLGQEIITEIDSNVITYENYFETEAPGYYLPSATITEGETIKVMGVNADGSFVEITEENSDIYISILGTAVEVVGPVTDPNDTASSFSSSSSSSSSYAYRSEDFNSEDLTTDTYDSP